MVFFCAVGKDEQVTMAQLASMTASTTSLPEIQASSPALPSLESLSESAGGRMSAAAPAKSSLSNQPLGEGAKASSMADGKDAFEKERAEMYRQLDEKVRYDFSWLYGLSFADGSFGCFE